MQVMLPSFRTLNAVVPPTCKFMSNDAAADAVLVTFRERPVKVTAPLFQVCVAEISGLLVVTVPPVSVRQVAAEEGAMVWPAVKLFAVPSSAAVPVAGTVSV